MIQCSWWICLNVLQWYHDNHLLMKLLLKVWTKVGCHLAEGIARCVSHSRVLQQQQICSHCIFSNTQQFDKNLAIPTRQQTFGNICHWSFTFILLLLYLQPMPNSVTKHWSMMTLSRCKMFQWKCSENIIYHLKISNVYWAKFEKPTNTIWHW